MRCLLLLVSHKVTPAEYTKLASFTVSFPWSCSAWVTTSKNLPFSDIRNPSSDLDLSSDADTSILNESSDNINIVHVQPTPSPNSSLSTCQLPAPPTHTKVSSGLKGMIINCNSLKGPSRFSEFQVRLDFHKPDIILGCESKLDCEVPTYSVFPPTYSVFVMGRGRGGLSPKSFARKCLTLEKIAKSSGHQLRSVTVKLSTKHLVTTLHKMFWNNFQIPFICLRIL